MKRLAVAAAVVALAALPFCVGGTYYVNIASQILLYAVFALGINVLVGYAGLVTLGHAGLFGIAAYAGARILNERPRPRGRRRGRSRPGVSLRPRCSRCWRSAAPGSASS